MALVFFMIWLISYHCFGEELRDSNHDSLVNGFFEYPQGFGFNDFQVTLGLHARGFQDSRVDQSFLVGPVANFSGDLNRGLIQFHFDFDFRFEAGSVQSQFGENIPQNGIFVRNAQILLQSIIGDFSLGLLNHNQFDNPLVLNDQSFPSVQFDWKSIFFELKTGLSVPTSMNLDPYREESDPLPFLTEAHLVKETSAWRVSFSWFDFHDLPSSVAFSSMPHGNSVEALSGRRYKFVEPFGIAVADGRYRWRVVDKHSLNARWMEMVNVRARSHSKRGQILSLLWLYSPNVGAKWGFECLKVFNEKNVSPAYYNSYKWGHNNREGWGVAISHENSKKSKASLAFHWTEPILDSPYQNSISFLEAKWDFAL